MYNKSLVTLMTLFERAIRTPHQPELRWPHTGNVRVLRVRQAWCESHRAPLQIMNFLLHS